MTESEALCSQGHNANSICYASFMANRISLQPQGFNITTSRASNITLSATAYHQKIKYALTHHRK